MNEDKEKNKVFEFLACEEFLDNDYMNRFVLKINEDKYMFFENFDSKNKNHKFFVEDNILYISDDNENYAFKLGKKFSIFFDQIIEENVVAFYIIFMFDKVKKAYSFTFIGER